METDIHNQSHNIDPRRVTWLVIWSQALWTAGYSLTTGGFLLYFGYELGADNFKIALLLSIPETVGIFGLATRWVIRLVGNRKRVWFFFRCWPDCFHWGSRCWHFPACAPTAFTPFGC